MRLLLLDQFSDLGGAQQGLLELMPALSNRGWRVVVGLPGEGALFERMRESGIEVQRIACGPYASGQKGMADAVRFAAGTPVLARQIRRMAGALDAQLIYVNGPRVVPAAAVARLPIPLLFHAHSFLFPGSARRLTGMALRRAGARVVGSCEFVAEPWRACVGDDRVSVIYNGVAGRPAMRAARHGAPTVGCIGRIAPEKGQREFLEAARAIHAALPQCRFLVFGAALFGEPGALRYEAEVRTRAEGFPVEFRGWVEDVWTALAELDLLLVPSAGHEATTRVILEAYAAGVPVIAFPSGGIPEVVVPGHSGLLAESTEEMARQAVALLTAGPERLEQMSHRAREHWQRNYTLERYHQDLIRLMEEVAGGVK